MKKSKKTIVYMLVALFVAVSVVFVDFGSCNAAESSLFDGVIADNKFHYYRSDSEKKIVESYDFDTVLNEHIGDLEKLARSKTNIGSNTIANYENELFVYETSGNVMKNNRNCIAIHFLFDGEYVLVAQKGVPKDNSNYAVYNKGDDVFYFGLVSKKENNSLGASMFIEPSEDFQSCILQKCIELRPNVYTYNGAEYKFIMLEDTIVNCGINASKLKVFDSVESATKYLDSGDTSGMAWQGSTPKQTYNKDAHFDKFNMDVHASNSLDNYYVDFRYSLPNNLVGKGYSLRIDSTYRREVTNSVTGESMFSKDYTDYQYVTLSDNPFSCRIYLKDFNSVKASFKDKYSDPFSKYMDVTSKNYDAVYLGVTSHIDQIGYKVTMSLLNLTCKLYRSGECGYAYSGSLDLLTGANDIGSYTPDSSGNYKPNNDYRQNGYYYTDVSTDAAENTTYNYYYITNDNSRTEISKDDNDNNTKSGEGIGGNSSSSASTSGNITNNNNPTFTNNNTITIEGDNINNEVNNIVDSSSSAEDNKNFIEKFLGFFQLLENNSFLGVWGKVFGWLPPGISSVITTALGISAGIGIFRFFRR